jgi:hypothetical protein
MALACACAPTWCWAGDTASDNADKAGQVDAYARDQLGIGIDELAWLIEAACDDRSTPRAGSTFIARKPALDRLAQKGFVKLVEFGSPEFVAVLPDAERRGGAGTVAEREPLKLDGGHE